MIELARPNTELAASYFDFIAEMREHGETIWPPFLPQGAESTAEFVERVLSGEHGPGPSLVSESVYWATLEGVVVGRIALRHSLNANLEEFGGHIGYEVRPSYRRRGVGKEMLRLLLQVPKAKELGRVLLTCAPDNVGSNKTILANGGTLARTAFVESRQRQTNYYWIDVNPA